MNREWIPADDKSQLPHEKPPEGEDYYFVGPVLLCILPKTDEDLADDFADGPCIDLGAIHVDKDGECSFVLDADPYWGQYTAYWMPLPEPPAGTIGITYGQWKRERSKP